MEDHRTIMLDGKERLRVEVIWLENFQSPRMFCRELSRRSDCLLILEILYCGMYSSSRIEELVQNMQSNIPTGTANETYRADHVSYTPT
jgi:hypothetical protein